MIYLPFLLLALILFYIEATVSQITVLCPDVNLILLVYLGLFARSERVFVAAALLGFLRACLSMDITAVFVLMDLVVAMSVLWIRGAVYRERISSQWVITLIAGFVSLLVRFAFSVMSLPDNIGLEGLAPESLAIMSAVVIAPMALRILRALRLWV